jgi:hypothetical protein
MAEDKLKDYVHAMEIDIESNKPMPKVAAELTGDRVVEQKNETHAVNGVVTFSEEIDFLEIYNTDAENKGTFVVNGLDILVPAGGIFKASYGGIPSVNVSVTGSTSYILTRYE